MIFDYGINTLADFTTYFKDRLDKPCDAAVDWGYNHTWEDVSFGCPLEFGYEMLRQFLDVMGPLFRRGTIIAIGREPFWAALTWMTVVGLTQAEYNYLFAKGYPKENFARRVLDGSLEPGSRATVGLATGRGRS
jgi:hypothetical protein